MLLNSMPQDFEKYIGKLAYKERLLALDIITRIIGNKLEGLDVVKMANTKQSYRVRHGKLRYIFKKTESGNIIIKVGPRGDVYK